MKKACILLLLLLNVEAIARSTSQRTLRQALETADSIEVSLVPDNCLDQRVVPEGSERYIRVVCHLNPSAEETFIFSRDGQLKGSIYGWALVTLANDLIVYQ